LLTETHRALETWVGGATALDDETMLVVAFEGTALAGVGHTDEAIDARALLARARARGRRIEFPAQVDDLASLRDWLEQDPAANGLEAAEFEVMYTVLHETVANIAEHGLGGDPRRRFEMWNVPEGRAADGATPATGHLCFLIRDDGQPFRPEGWSPTDFSDRETWRRGRGIGLDIIFRGTRFVSYQPGTPEGNLTVLAFDPEHLSQPLRERRHA
jgi:anti-sigma regulatory factor (Ser/Thr protein kinase)